MTCNIDLKFETGQKIFVAEKFFIYNDRYFCQPKCLQGRWVIKNESKKGKSKERDKKCTTIFWDRVAVNN